ncbi:UDP-N-acetylglucosamine 2-epimerase (non-hydrolyzing) [bacterium]|nr:UDP-N-acetylglucosamine 2-epimerase (non-hydrolyzing) [bacterium]MBU1073672.1 UDP-N-acetylglucosamine 2-epimerase (non-hydrolyzing) [bacterium]MBU1675882.1 UDP-N-acetylglucosamine 2-epimerase (non-hydrolyzing) [bacterium]
MSQKIFLIAAARPNFMKIAPIWRVLVKAEGLEPVLIHTGQHYDMNMSDVFFADLGLPRPNLHLGVGSGSHAEQTAGVMLKLERICREDRPALVLVVGDVNATMAAAITAKKLCIPVAHVEAGLRSRDWTMPEEVNRILTDAVADLLFTPSQDADDNLRAEGVAEERIKLVGNVMIDSLVNAVKKSRALAKHADFGLDSRGYGLVTLHRPANVDDPASLRRLCDGLDALGTPLIFPVHPRTRKVMAANRLSDRFAGDDSQVTLTEPMGYDDFLNLTMHARFLLTDSGGIQEETTYLGIPCLTLRPNTERPITIDVGTNELATLDSLPGQVARILAGEWKKGRVPDLWDGETGTRIVAILRTWLGARA